jgi:hypothetical protein
MQRANLVESGQRRGQKGQGSRQGASELSESGMESNYDESKSEDMETADIEGDAGAYSQDLYFLFSVFML